MLSLIGGIGLFLLGMILLTEGLKSFAGDSLRRALLRFTGRPVSAFLSGAVVTSMVQSSSATTLTTIGFVSAGLMSFTQAVGVVMGASLGTTSTGWLVSLFGLKYSVTTLVFPLIGAGAFIRLLAYGRFASLGLAMAGFGLIFVGIDQLQAGMSGVADQIDLAAIPSTGLLGHLLMMATGIVLTVLMQSSSAAVAMTLTALHTGAIHFEQAASLVIGSAVGTTVTAGLAAIGASTSAKRTALAHVLFNLFTGIVAVVLLPVFLWLLEWAQRHDWLDAGAVSLAAFHTGFIALGVLIFLPFVGGFSRLIERILPERGPRLTRHLDPSLLTLPPVAMEAARNGLRESAALLFRMLAERLDGRQPDRVLENQSLQVEQAMHAVSDFISRTPPVEHERPGQHIRRDSFHAIDHIGQLLPQVTQSQSGLESESLKSAATQSSSILRRAADYLSESSSDLNSLPDAIQCVAVNLANWRKSERQRLLEVSADGGSSAVDSLNRLDAIRWIDQITYHAWRITHHLRREN